MPCEVCYHLLAAYQRSVILFSDAVRKGGPGATEDDSLLAIKEAWRLSWQCKEAHDALRAHWRQEHPSQLSAGQAG